MYVLKDNDGQDTSDPVVMRRLAVDFYSNLSSAKAIEEQSRIELLQDIPSLTVGNKTLLEVDLNFEEVTAAVNGLSSGSAPGIDGLSSDFFFTFFDFNRS